MKLHSTLCATVLLVFGSAAASLAADSKRTAEFLLSSPLNHEGKEVTVDVALVKPVNWKSPFPELTFFQAMTMDRSDYKPGGVILVAVATEKSAAFAKKYGTDFEGRRDTDSLKGLFMVSGRRKIWVIDTTGQLEKLQTERKVSLPDEAAGPHMGGEFPGGPKGPGHPGHPGGPRRPQQP